MNKDIEPIIKEKEFKYKVEHLKTLPTLPHLMMRFTQLAKDPHVSMSIFGDEVQKDQILTTKLLKLVNSAYYGFPGRISTVTQALVLLGLDALKGLIITSSVFDGLTPEAYPLWRHSLLVSLACRHICNQLNIPDTEEIAVAGLLHDIGKVILILEATENYRKVINEAVATETSLYLVEQKMMHFDHTDVGSWLCEKWTLPEKLHIPIKYHHNVDSSGVFFTRTSVLYVADTLIKALGAPAEQIIPIENIPDKIVSHLNLKEENLIKIAEKLIPENESIQKIGPGDIK